MVRHLLGFKPWGTMPTPRRVFERVNPEALQRCFLGWVSQVVKQAGAQVIPIDGKCMKAPDRKKKQSALHVVSAWASEHRLLLGQVKVEDKTNEIKAIPSLLELLDITVHHYRCHGYPNRDCDQIVGKGADYILSLKANHPTLLAEVKAWFDAAQAIGFEGLNTAMTNGSKQAIIAGKRDKFGWFALTKWVDFINNPNGRAYSVVIVMVRIRHLEQNHP